MKQGRAVRKVSTMGLTLVAALGGLIFGYDTAVISGAVASIDNDFIRPLNLPEFWRDTASGLTISSALAGCVIGGAIAGSIADRFGRKRGLILAAVLFLLSAVGSAVPEVGVSSIGTTDLAALVAFNAYRVLCGIGIGIASMLSPLYIAEVAPKERRGQLVSLYQMAIVIGIVTVYFINWWIARGAEPGWIDRIGWRLMLGSEGVPALIFLVLLTPLPDTPRWFMLRGREDEARAVLESTARPGEAPAILEEIRASLQAVPSTRLLAFGSGVILIGLALSVFQQLVGINAVLYYAPLMFRNLGAGDDSAMLQTVLIGAANMLATLLAIYAVDRHGRKPLLLLGSAGMALPMIALGYLFTRHSQGVLALACVLVYIVAFAMSWGPIVWVLLSEIFPGPIRGKAMAVAVAMGWTANLLVSWSFKILDGNSALNAVFNHGFAYFLYGVMSILSGIFVYRYVPETAGRSLEAIQGGWASRRPSSATATA